MTTYNNSNGLWDLSLPPQLPSLGDDDFIALLQKQFGVQNDITIPIGKPPPSRPIIGNINPQALTSFPISGPTPPLSDDSPSPPSAHDTSRSRRESGVFSGSGNYYDANSDDEGGLKRKASEEFEEDHNAKSQHTSGSTSAKKGSSSVLRRKSTGNPADEHRLVKRKEQNRAAQRAFRERKEKHVKDLEEKVAVLEEKSSVISQENDTLRDVIAHLQSENMRLRDSSFTFSMPSSSSHQARKDPMLPQDPSSSHSSPANQYNNMPRSSASSATASSQPSPQSFYANDKETNGISFYNSPGVFESDAPFTAINDVMNMGFNLNGMVTETPFKTIASNPMYMSFREPYPHVPQLQPSGYSSNASSASQPSGVFEFVQPQQQRQNSSSSWPDVPMPQELNQPYDMMNNSLDELFGGAYVGSQNPVDYSIFRSPANSLSPVSHHNGRSPSGSSTGESPQNSHTPGQQQEGCPKTKSELANVIARSGGSVFAQNGLEHSGQPLPKTHKSEKNVEVMAAFDTIRSKYKDIDVNSLCKEFAEKAKCDGCQVVIEPAGMQQILKSVAARQRMPV